MTDHFWQRLEYRLRSVANDKQWDKYRSQNRDLALITLKIFTNNGRLIGWTRPQREQIESPDLSLIPFTQTDWNSLLSDLQYQSRHNSNPYLQCSLIVKNGELQGWFMPILA